MSYFKQLFIVLLATKRNKRIRSRWKSNRPAMAALSVACTISTRWSNVPPGVIPSSTRATGATVAFWDPAKRWMGLIAAARCMTTATAPPAVRCFWSTSCRTFGSATGAVRCVVCIDNAKKKTVALLTISWLVICVLFSSNRSRRMGWSRFVCIPAVPLRSVAVKVSSSVLLSAEA